MTSSTRRSGRLFIRNITIKCELEQPHLHHNCAFLVVKGHSVRAKYSVAICGIHPVFRHPSLLVVVELERCWVGRYEADAVDE